MSGSVVLCLFPGAVLCFYPHYLSLLLSFALTLTASSNYWTIACSCCSFITKLVCDFFSLCRNIFCTGFYPIENWTARFRYSLPLNQQASKYSVDFIAVIAHSHTRRNSNERYNSRLRFLELVLEPYFTSCKSQTILCVRISPYSATFVYPKVALIWVISPTFITIYSMDSNLFVAGNNYLCN